MKRCFIAVNFPREVINEIKRIQIQIKNKNLFIGRFTEPENLHLTLKFLGEIDDEKIEEVKQRMEELKLRKFESKLGLVGIFSKKVMRIIWIKLDGKIFGLQKEIDNKLKNLFESEHRFMSHITIARIKHVDKKNFYGYLASIKPEKIKFEVKEFYLMESELTTEGPVYREIGKYNLF